MIRACLGGAGFAKVPGYGTERGAARIRSGTERVRVVSAADRNHTRDLALRAARGDVGAFGSLVQEHSGLVYRVALRVLGARGAQGARPGGWGRGWRGGEGLR